MSCTHSIRAIGSIVRKVEYLLNTLDYLELGNFRFFVLGSSEGRIASNNTVNDRSLLARLIFCPHVVIMEVMQAFLRSTQRA